MYYFTLKTGASLVSSSITAFPPLACSSTTNCSIPFLPKRK